MSAIVGKYSRPQKEDDLKYEDNLKNEDDLKDEDGLNNEDILKIEDDLEKEDNLKNSLKNEDDLKYQSSTVRGHAPTACNAAPTVKSKMATRGPKKNQRGSGMGSTVSLMGAPNNFC